MTIYDSTTPDLNRQDIITLAEKRKIREISKALDALDFQGARFIMNEGGGGAFTLGERKMLLRILGAEDGGDDSTTIANLQDEDKTTKRIMRITNMPTPAKGFWKNYWKTVGANLTGTSTLLNGLEAWWDLDEASGNRADSSAAGAHLTDGFTVGSTTGKTSALASVTTGGTSENLSNTSFYEPDDEDFTISGWMNLSSTNGSNFILGNDDFTNGYYFGTYIAGAGTVEWAVAQTRVSTAVSTGSWIHFLLYHDSVGDEIGLVLDHGTPITTTHVGGANTSGSTFDGIQLHNLWVGAYSGGVALNSVAVHSRLLTASEFDEIYNDGNGRKFGTL